MIVISHYYVCCKTLSRIYIIENILSRTFYSCNYEYVLNVRRFDAVIRIWMLYMLYWIMSSGISLSIQYSYICPSTLFCFCHEGKILFLSCVQVYEKGAQTLDKVEKLNRPRLKKLIDDFVRAYARWTHFVSLFLPNPYHTIALFFSISVLFLFLQSVFITCPTLSFGCRRIFEFLKEHSLFLR